MKSFYAYIRVSTVKQGEHGSSLNEQRFSIENYAKKHNLIISQWFEETETAAKRGRTLFTKMLALLIKGKASGLIIHKIDRGARNLKDWADLGSLLDSGVEIHFAHESLDMQSRGGRLAADIQAVVAADFIRNLREEVRKGFQGRLRQGIYPLRAPIGYVDNGRGMPKTPHPIMAPLIKKAFRLYSTGDYNLHTLGEEMHKEGLRNRYANRVSINGLSTILHNEFYIGIMHIVTTAERHLGIHEPLIKRGEFERVQAVLKGRTKNEGMKNVFRYRKTLRCFSCNHNLIAERQKGIVYYRCQTKVCPRPCVREDSIDSQVVSKLETLMLSEVDIAGMEKEFSYLQAERLKRNHELVKTRGLIVSDIEDRLSRLTDAYIDRMIDKETFEERNRKLLLERVNASELLNESRELIDGVDKKTQIFLELVKSISFNAKTSNELEKLNMLKSATSNFQVEEKKLIVKLKNPFEALSSGIESPYCDPNRDTSRTFKKNPSEFSKRLFKLIHEEEL